MGYARFWNWRIYGEEGLVSREAALWLYEKTLTVETLSCYDVEWAKSTSELRAITRPRLFETSHTLSQLRLFGLDALGQGGWLKGMLASTGWTRGLNLNGSHLTRIAIVAEPDEV